MFVPADSEKKLGKAMDLGADVIIVDLEDSVAPQNKAQGRELARDWLERTKSQALDPQAPQRWIRINALDTEDWATDLRAVMPGAPAGIVLPKALGPDSVSQLAGELYQLEQAGSAQKGTTRILPLVSEAPQAALTIGAYATASLPRLGGLTWGAEDLSAAIGASRKRDGDRNWTDAFRMIRAQMLLAAHASGVPAIDTLWDDFADMEGLEAAARNARADGFAGMLAIHPNQVEAINRAFTPSEEEIEEARRIVAAFASQPGVGTLSLDGKMLDQPHLQLARRILGMDS
jgi:citrate lyase subunit beta/citryl-CoA lyase